MTPTLHLGYICEPNDFHNVDRRWGSFFVNVYSPGYGFPRQTREDAITYSGNGHKPLYRIRVIPTGNSEGK